MNRLTYPFVLLIYLLLAAAVRADPLPSWHDGPAKTAIQAFVTAVTRESGPDFVPPSERIAVFDNDGTLWPEQPMYVQLAFALDRLKTLAPQRPEWKEKQPFKAALEGDLKALGQAGEHGLIELVMASHAGMTTDEFAQIVADWLATARHPKFNRPYTELSYQPMLELLAYLRANGFKTYIVSGGIENGCRHRKRGQTTFYSIRDDTDYATRFDDIHYKYKPVKHDWAKRAGELALFVLSPLPAPRRVSARLG